MALKRCYLNGGAYYFLNFLLRKPEVVNPLLVFNKTLHMKLVLRPDLGTENIYLSTHLYGKSNWFPRIM